MTESSVLIEPTRSRVVAVFAAEPPVRPSCISNKWTKSIVCCLLLSKVIVTCLFVMLLWLHFTRPTITQWSPLCNKDCQVFLAKTLHSLEQPQLIRYKPTGDFLGTYLDFSNHTRRYWILSVANYNVSTSQRWQLVNGTLTAGQWIDQDKASYELCLDGVLGEALYLSVCNNIKQFSLHMEIDYKSKQVYFVIRDIKQKGCVGLNFSESLNVHVFGMQNCTGADDQQFYLSDANYNNEFIKTQFHHTGSIV